MLKSLARLFSSRTGKQAGGQVATPQDVEACFRLLLGRDPNAEERYGHMLQVGQPLGRVVAGYLSSLEFSQRRLLVPPAATATRVEFDGFHMFADPDDAAVGRHILNAIYEPEVTAVLRRTLQPGMAFIDLGANIGYFSMLAAALVGPGGSVLAVEPNPDNVRLLEASRRSNGFEHVTCMQVAAGRRLGLLMLNATHSNGTTSTIADDVATVLMAKTVACAPLDLLVEGDRAFDVIKIDVEGAEYNALLGAERLLARDRPLIISEFSPGLLQGISGIEGEDYLRWLRGLGYDLAVILPDGELQHVGQETATVMQAYVGRGVDHIDIVALPRA